MTDQLQADHGYSEERIREFVVLAAQILDNAWARRNLETTTQWDAASGTWTIAGPTEDELKLLVIDLRNVIQKGSDLSFTRLLDDLSSAIPDPEARRAIVATRARLVSIEEHGTTTVNGRALRPGSVARLWLYSHYHHRELAKLRQLRALQGFEPLVYRLEFLQYLSAIVGEVAALCDFIIAAQELGHLGTIPGPRRSWQEHEG